MTFCDRIVPRAGARAGLLAGALAASLLAAGCASSGSASAGAASPTAAPSSASATGTLAAPAPASSAPAAATSSTPAAMVELKTARTSLGTVLTDARGFTLYWFAKDSGRTSACTGACAVYWPPVTGSPAPGIRAAGHFGTITRAGGVLQVTWNGHPLYLFKGDTAPGQVHGNGVNGFGALWYAVVLTPAAPAPAPSSMPPAPAPSSQGYGY